MSIDSESPAVPPAPSPLESQPKPVAPAMVAYLSRIRRQRRIYIAVLAVIAAVALTITLVVMNTGEIANATLHQAQHTVAGPSDTTTSTNPKVAWTKPERLATGNPAYLGIVVTYGTHTVTGRNYATGDAVWSYTRSDVAICTVFQETGTIGTTIAIFKDRDGFCDEADAFKTSNGARAWYRTLDSNGNTLYGVPTWAQSQYTILVISPPRPNAPAVEPAYVQAFDPAGGIDRWTFIQPAGCTNTTAVLGSGGVLMGQQCADGSHLLLRDAYAGDDDDNKAKAKWNLANTSLIPLSADDVISALDPKTGSLVRFAPDNGKIIDSKPLSPKPDPKGAVSADAVGNSELITIGDNTYAIDIATGRQVWTAALAGPPTVSGTTVLSVTAAAITKIDVTTGDTTMQYPIANAVPGSPVYPLGTGFVVGGSSTTVYK